MHKPNFPVLVRFGEPGNALSFGRCPITGSVTVSADDVGSVNIFTPERFMVAVLVGPLADTGVHESLCE
jgi:hypothetical protein